MDAHIWPGKSRTTSSNIHSAGCEDTGCGPEDLPEAMNVKKWHDMMMIKIVQAKYRRKFNFNTFLNRSYIFKLVKNSEVHSTCEDQDHWLQRRLKRSPRRDVHAFSTTLHAAFKSICYILHIYICKPYNTQTGWNTQADWNTQVNSVVQVRTHLLTSDFSSSTRREGPILKSLS